MEPEKRLLRKLKRQVKKQGTRHARRQLKRDLSENPTEAHHAELDFGHDESAHLNGLDQDATRRRERE
jgi:hypothetical protein